MVIWRHMTPRRQSRAHRVPMAAGYFELILRRFGTTPATKAALLAGTKVSLDRLTTPGLEITLGQQLRQIRNANRLFAPGWALRLGAAYQTSMHGAVGVAATTAPTLGDTLRVLERFLHLRMPAFRARQRRRGADLRLELVQVLVLRDEEHLPVVETLLQSIQGIIEVVIGRGMSAGHFEIAAPAPDYAGRYRRYLRREVRCAAATTAAVIPVTWASLRNPFADPGMHTAAMSTLELHARRLERPDFLAARLEHEMVANGAAGLPLAAGAKRLGVSRRTLGRRLRAAGTSYRELRDAHRRGEAEAMLRDGGLTATEMAYRLGYENAANFGRACRRWFGTAPGALRLRA